MSREDALRAVCHVGNAMILIDYVMRKITR